MVRRKELSREYLTAALERARNSLSKDDFSAIHRAALPASGGMARNRPKSKSLEDALAEMGPEEYDGLITRLQEKRQALRDAGQNEIDASQGSTGLNKSVGYHGPIPCDLLFVLDQPSATDLIRGELLTGPAGATFRDVYLKSLDLTREAIGLVAADLDLVDVIAKVDPIHIVALGREAEEALLDAGHAPDETLPHPNATRTRPARAAQVIRKLARVRKSLEGGLDTDLEIAARRDRASLKPTKPEVTREVTIAKVDQSRQIIYGVVLDPYAVDRQGDWIPPNHVEKAAHDWLSQSRIMGRDHIRQANAFPVESWIQPYPSEDDYQRAMRGEPHRAYRQKFGKDTVHSGAWILGTKLQGQEWSDFQKGEIDAYSIGGKGYRTPVSDKAMPDVTFVDLVEVTDRSKG